MFVDLQTLDQVQTYLNQDKKVVLDFYADWCPPCKKFIPIFERVSELNEFSDFVFVKVNVDLFPELSGSYSVTSIPTIVFLKPNAPAKKIVGYKEEDDFINLIYGHYF